MDERLVRVTNEVDWRTALQQQRQGEREMTDSYGRIAAAGKRIDASAAATGVAWQRGAQLGARAMTAMSAAIGAANAATAAQERSWLSLGQNILLSFAAGGPIAGGISIIGAGVGLLTSRVDASAAAAAKARVAYTEWMKKVNESRDAARAAVQDIGGKTSSALHDALGKFINPELEQKIAGLEKSLQALRLEEARLVNRNGPSTLIEENRNKRMATIGEIDDLGKQLRTQAMAEQIRSAVSLFESMKGLGVQPMTELGKAGEQIAKAQDALKFLQSLDSSKFAPLEHDATGMRDAIAAIAAKLKDEVIPGLERAREIAGTNAAWDIRSENADLRERVLAARQSLRGMPSNEARVAREIHAVQERIDFLMLTEAREKAFKDELRRLDLRKQALQEVLRVEKEITAAQVGRVNQGLEREIELLQARNDVERELIRLRHRREDLLEQGAGASVVERLNRATLAAIAARPWMQLLNSAEDTLGRGLSDVIYDGIVNGFREGSDIAEQIFQALLRQMIHHVVTSGIQGLFSGSSSGGGGLLGIFREVLGLFGGGGGGGGFVGYGSGTDTFGGGALVDMGSGGMVGDIGGAPVWEAGPMAAGGIVRKPTLALIGEQGPEAVVPLHKAAQMGGGGGITVNVSVTGSGLTPQQTADMVAAAARTETLRVLTETSAGRTAVKRAAHRGL